MIRKSSRKVILHSRKAVGSIGRNASKRSGLGTLMRPLGPLTSVPFLREFVLHRKTFILKSSAELRSRDDRAVPQGGLRDPQPGLD